MNSRPQIVRQSSSLRSSNRKKSSGSLRSRLSARPKSKRSLESPSEHGVIREEEVESGGSFREKLTFQFFSSFLEKCVVHHAGTSMGSSITMMHKSFKVKQIQSDVMDKVEEEVGKEEQSKIVSWPNRDESIDTQDLYHQMGSHINKEVWSTSLSRQINMKDIEVSTSGLSILDFSGYIPMEADNFYMTFLNGNLYVGSILNKVMHGDGTFIWADGTRYEGSFKDGHPTGFGVMILPDLTTYTGKFYKGEFHGEGTFNIVNTKMLYSGSWNDGRKHGKGWMLYDHDTFYDGEWEDNLRQGWGLRQYSKLVKYKGNWYRGMRHGQGCMLYQNHDFYRGEWAEGKTHGYGEYTWNTRCHKSLLYTVQSWHKGSWYQGFRHGAGLMNFGSETGSKLAGIWAKNLKHGPGVMICGTGVCIHRSPLFLQDKALQFEELNVEQQHNPTPLVESNFKMTGSETTIKEMEGTTSYQGVVKEINKKVAINLNDESLNAQDNVLNDALDQRQFEPLDTPIHGLSENVNLEFYVELVCNHRFKMAFQNNMSSDPIVTKPLPLVVDLEKKHLRIIIIENLPFLNEVYKKYSMLATLRLPGKNVKPLLIRLFLWQLYRDAGISNKGIMLVELDNLLGSDPTAYVESNFDPFEVIHFWQFLKSITATATLMYLRGLITVEGSGPVMAKMLGQFLNETIVPNVGKFEGMALTKYRNLLPIKELHGLYQCIGEGHTAKDFLTSLCVKRGFEPPCYLALLDGDGENDFVKGENVVPFDQCVEYIPDQPSLNEKTEERQTCMPQDSFGHTLYCLRFLGSRRVINCLAAVCPLIKNDEFIVNMDYRLTFLEFHEVLLLCALTYIRKTLWKKERLVRYQEWLQVQDILPSKPSLKVVKETKKK